MDQNIIWAVEGSCPKCLFVICCCSSTDSPLDSSSSNISVLTNTSIYTNFSPEKNIEKEKNFKNVSDNAIERVLRQKLQSFRGYQGNSPLCKEIVDEIQPPKNRPVLKWKYRGQLVLVKSNVDWSDYERDDEFMRERDFVNKIKAWAKYSFPSDWETVFEQGITKYAVMLKNNPGMSESYYMKAIKNDCIDQWKKTQAVRYVELVPTEDMSQEFAHIDRYIYEKDEWRKTLTPNQIVGLKEANQWLEDNDENYKKMPKHIKRKLYGIKIVNNTLEQKVPKKKKR